MCRFEIALGRDSAPPSIAIIEGTLDFGGDEGRSQEAGACRSAVLDAARRPAQPHSLSFRRQFDPTVIMNLTQHLLGLPQKKAAAEHRFLIDAGNGVLPDARLALWLAQDRIYAAHAYPRFVGRLLAAIPYSSAHRTTSPEEIRHARILKTLVYSLNNVVREIGFFDELAARWRIDVNEWEERKATRDYTAEMARISIEGNLFEGLVFLWAMEMVRSACLSCTANPV
jgi:thiaminase